MQINYLSSYPSTKPICPYYHVLAVPLVHIFSVSVHAETTSQVYGSIQATEFNAINSTYIYDRDHTNPETLSHHGTLSLTGPHNISELILGTTQVAIDVCLKDGNSDTEIINAQFYLDPTIPGIENSYDKLMKACIQGEWGFAYLYYTTFRFAVYAQVEITITEKRGNTSCLADVYGSVVACYGKYCSSDDESKYLDTVLFDKPSSQPVQVMVGAPIKLLRSVVVLPAYSTLIINANISDSRGQLASGHVVFPVEDDAGFSEIIRSDNACVQVVVEIHSAYPRIYKSESFNACTTVAASSDGTMSKMARTSGNQQHPSSSKHGWMAPELANPPKISGCLMAEVFSVYIGGINCKVSSLCGSIKVDDGDIPFFIYESSSDVVPDDKMVCIQGDKPIKNVEFRMFTDLKDPVLNLEVSKGMVAWNAGLLDFCYGIEWHNKRICSVVQGAHGYAAIHHMIFYSALAATVEVTFLCDNNLTTNVDGVIAARYGGHEYSTDYDNKYYKSSLFKRSENNAEHLSTNSRIPLSKSLVAVHVNSSLVVEANLRVIYNHNRHEEIVFGEVEFSADMSREFIEKIGKGSCRIEVSVKFCRPY